MLVSKQKVQKKTHNRIGKKPMLIKPSISIDAAKKIGAVGHDLETLICELIDNPIPNEKPKNPIKVDIRINYDGDNSFIQILDNSIGIPKHSIPDAFNYGKSANFGKLRLSRMGMGMKIVTFALGELDYIITKTKNNPEYILKINNYTDTKEELAFVLDEYSGSEFPQYESGTLIKIKNCSEMIRNWTDKKYFDKFCSKIESTYPQLLNEFLDIRITYTKPGNTLWMHDCIAYKPLMSNPERIINTTNGLGENSPILDRFQLDVQDYPDVRAYLTCWHKPHPLTVTETFNNTKDVLYDPKKYSNSPWNYGDEFSGIALGMRGKILEWNLDKKSSRNERHGILLEVEDGLDYTALKSGVKKTKRYKQIIKAVNDKLDEIDFYERSTALTPAISESKYMDKFFDRLKNDDVFKLAFKIKDFDKQVKIRPLCGVGAPDGVIYNYNDPNKVDWVIEGKKDKGAGDECGQLVRYMAHYKCEKGIFVSPVKNAQFDQQLKDFNDFFGKNAIIKNIDISWVNSYQFFSI
jgi:hypothetical protein